MANRHAACAIQAPLLLLLLLLQRAENLPPPLHRAPLLSNSGPNSNGSQFFLTYKAHSHLNGKYTVFGQVIDGMDTLDKMEKVPVDGQDRPKQELRINRVTMHANPLAG